MSDRTRQTTVCQAGPKPNPSQPRLTEDQSPVESSTIVPRIEGIPPLLRRLAPPQQHGTLLAWQRAHGNAAVQRQIKRRHAPFPSIVQRDVTKKIPFFGQHKSIWGDSVSQVTYKPRGRFSPAEKGAISTIEFPDGGGAIGTVQIQAGSSGVLQMTMQIVVDERGRQPGSPATFRQSFAVQWRVRAAANGDVTIGPGTEHRQPPTSDRVTRSRLSQVKHEVVSDNAADRHYVTVNPVISGTVYQTTMLDDSTSVPSQTHEFDQPFTLNVKVIKKQPKMGPPFALHSEPVFFRVKSHRLEDGQHDVLKRFYHGLDSAAKDGIARGTATVHIDAYASTPGSHEDNQDLSRNRGQRVRQLLMDWSGLNEARANHLRVYANGETSHRKRGEARSERRAEVWIMPFEAP